MKRGLANIGVGVALLTGCSQEAAAEEHAWPVMVQMDEGRTTMTCEEVVLSALAASESAVEDSSAVVREVCEGADVQERTAAPNEDDPGNNRQPTDPNIRLVGKISMALVGFMVLAGGYVGIGGIVWERSDKKKKSE